MAITILPSDPSLGAALGTGISSGLEYLAQQKIGDIQAQRMLPAIKAMFPQFSDEQALAFARSPAHIQKEYLKQFIPLMQAAPIESAFEDILSGTIPSTGMQALPGAPIQKFPETVAREVPSSTTDQFEQRVPSTAQLQQASQLLSTPAGLQSLLGMGAPPSVEQPMIPSPTVKTPTKAAKEIEQQATRQISSLSPGGKAEEEEQKMEDYLLRSNLTPRQKQQVRERFEKRHEKLKKEQLKIDKEVQPYFQQLMKEAKVARENNKRLDRIEKLTREGNLGYPIVNSFFKTLSKGIFGIGLDLTSIMTADAQELDKLSNDFVIGAKDYFGSRLTDADLKAFMQRVPTLFQSNEGRLKVINDFRNFNEAARVKEEVARDIIKQNHGKKPENLAILVEERAAPLLDRLAFSIKESALGPQASTSALTRVAQGLGLAY